MKWTLCVTFPKFVTIFIRKNSTISNNCKTSADGGGFSAFFVYCLAGYWAVNRTIYANYVMYGDLATIFMRKVIVGMLAGPVCIPLAIIKTVAGKKGGE